MFKIYITLDTDLCSENVHNIFTDAVAIKKRFSYFSSLKTVLYVVSILESKNNDLTF